VKSAALLTPKRRAAWPRRVRHVLFPALWVAAASAAHAAKLPPWPKIDRSEIVQAKPTLSAEAAAEVNLLKIDIDDDDFPDSRKTLEYIRFKIFDPEKAAGVTRVSVFTQSSEGADLNKVEIRARLSLPDGTIREFGRESMQERTVEESNVDESWLDRLLGSEGTVIHEQFLPVPGIVPGAVLEYQVSTTVEHPPMIFATSFQRKGVPIRQLEYHHRVSTEGNFAPHAFMLNGATLQANFKPDLDHSLITVTARNLPPLVDEPYSATVFDRSLTLIGSYTPIKIELISRHDIGSVDIDREAGPWTPLASRIRWFEEDATAYDHDVAKLAPKLTTGAASQTEAARRIHDYVHGRYLDFLRSPRAGRPSERKYIAAPLSEVIAFEKYPDTPITDQDFLWLAVALDREAGLKPQTILMSNRRILRFDQRLVSDGFLHDSCVRVFVDGAWKFSAPNLPEAVPFGALPWWNRGGSGLIAQYNKQEFVAIPTAPSADSVIDNTGDFKLGADGAVTGAARRTLTGDPAMMLRRQLRKADDARRREILQKAVQKEMDPAQVTLTDFTGVDDPNVPLVIEYRLNWPEFAAVTKSRMIFRPSIFHGQSKSPFAEEARRNLIEFPYSWREIDHVTLQLPAGLKLEAPSAPRSYPGDVLNYRIGLTYEPRHSRINLTRTFDSNLTSLSAYLPVQAYPELKRWFDLVAHSDGHELVLVKAAPAIAPHPAVPAVPPAPAGTAAPKASS